MDPSSHTFDYKDLAVSVATNNKTGYQLTMSTTSTSLINTADNTLTIPTLDALSGGYTTATFQTNKWGYSKDSGNYFPFPASELLLQNTTATNGDNTDLRFATKIDYTQPSGTYKTTISFNAVTNPLVDYIQDFTPDMCRTLASADDYTVVDKRDNNDYTVRYINGNCWMTKNLRFIGKTGDPAGIMTLDSSTSNVESVYTTSDPLVISYMDLTSGNSTTTAMLHTGTDSNGDPTAWYNYPATTAMQIASNVSTEATRSLCPAGWRLPTFSEQSIVINYPSEYNPVMGGHFSTGSIIQPNYGYWWASTAVNNTTTYTIQYYNNTLSLYNGGLRHSGVYVRCILNDPRTISDITTMQEMSPQIAAKMNNGDTATLTDSRDNQDYTVAKINGNVWMTRNLAIGCNGSGSTYGSTATSKTLTNTNSNISAVSWSTPTDSLTITPDSYTDPRLTCSTAYGAWYNYAAASAGTITGPSNTNAQVYDVCPIGWRIPTYAEQATLFGYETLFNPVIGGIYEGGVTSYTTMGFWWSSNVTADTTNRYYTYYDGTSLGNSSGTSARYRSTGAYVRCIAN